MPNSSSLWSILPFCCHTDPPLSSLPSPSTAFGEYRWDSLFLVPICGLEHREKLHYGRNIGSVLGSGLLWAGGIVHYYNLKLLCASPELVTSLFKTSLSCPSLGNSLPQAEFKSLFYIMDDTQRFPRRSRWNFCKGKIMCFPHLLYFQELIVAVKLHLFWFTSVSWLWRCPIITCTYEIFFKLLTLLLKAFLSGFTNSTF